MTGSVTGYLPGARAVEIVLDEDQPVPVIGERVEVRATAPGPGARSDDRALVAYLLHCVACGRCGWKFKGARPLPDCPEGQRLAAAVPPLDEAPLSPKEPTNG